MKYSSFFDNVKFYVSNEKIEMMDFRILRLTI